MADSVPKRLLDAIKVELAAIIGMQLVTLGAFPTNIASLDAGDDFPVAACKILSSDPLSSSLAGSGPLIRRTNSFAVVMLDNGRDESDTDWASDRAFEMESQLVAAVLADRTHGGVASQTTWTGTTYSPEGDWGQVDASVAVTFDIVTRNQEADLTAQDP